MPPGASSASNTLSFTTNSLNQYTATADTAAGNSTPTYDNRGNLTSFATPVSMETGGLGWKTDILGYDVHNRLIAGENDRWKISQQHDSQNRVVRRTIEKKGGVTPWKFDSETIFIYDGWSILEERTTNAAGDKTIRRYVHGPATDEIIRQDYFSSGSSIKSVYHHDLLGSNLCLSDTTGNAVKYFRYTAFGFPTILDTNFNAIPATKFGNRHLYTGREWLRELSLADHRNRHYTPHLARWTTTDPIKFNAGDVNLYRYCGNRAVDSRDSLGLAGYGSRFGLPEAFWNWYHRQHKCEGDNDIDKEEAKELYDDWVDKGEPNPEGSRTKQPRKQDEIVDSEPHSEQSNSSAGNTGLTTSQQAAIGVGAVGTGYLIYRAVRMIPSLLPPLWPAIPANLAIP